MKQGNCSIENLKMLGHQDTKKGFKYFKNILKILAGYEIKENLNPNQCIVFTLQYFNLKNSMGQKWK